MIVVHMGGRIADMDRLMALAQKNDLLLLEDCAHAHGSTWKGRFAGTFGLGGTFSFQSTKTMTAGEGGMIISNDDEFERLARSTHDCGRMPGRWFYDHYIYGSNYRMTEWQGAVLSVQLERLEEQVNTRHRNGRLLDELLADVEGVTPQSHDNVTRNGHYAYIFHYDAAAFGGVSAARFTEAIKAEGVPIQAAYPPLHKLDVFTSGAYKSRLCPEQANEDHAFLRQPFPNSHREAYETIWLPQYTLLGDETDMREIVQAVCKIQQQARELL